MLNSSFSLRTHLALCPSLYRKSSICFMFYCHLHFYSYLPSFLSSTLLPNFLSSHPLPLFSIFSLSPSPSLPHYLHDISHHYLYTISSRYVRMGERPDVALYTLFLRALLQQNKWQEGTYVHFNLYAPSSSFVLFLFFHLPLSLLSIFLYL